MYKDTIIKDAQEAFKDAINNRWLSQEKSSDVYAGDYMYMYSLKDGRNYFKHRDTRRYLAAMEGVANPGEFNE